MEFEIVEVKTRDEYRGAQEPLAFLWRGTEYRIEQVVDRWYEGRLDSTRMPMLYFRVRAGSGELFILRHHEFFRTWSIRVPEIRGV
ncbi:MAG: DUF6504 family protein [Syntrophobacteraceae bacterium]